MGADGRSIRADQPWRLPYSTIRLKHAFELRKGPGRLVPEDALLLHRERAALTPFGVKVRWC